MIELFIEVMGAAVLGTFLGVVWHILRRKGCPRCHSSIPAKKLLLGSSQDIWHCGTCRSLMRFNPALRRWRRVLRNGLAWSFLWVELIGRLVRMYGGGSFSDNFLPLPQWGYHMLLIAIVGVCLIPDTIQVISNKQKPSHGKPQRAV